MKKKPHSGRWAIGAVLIAAAIAAGLYYGRRGDLTTAASRDSTEIAPEPPAQQPAIQHPIEQALIDKPAEPTGPLPPLGNSDVPVLDVLRALPGGEAALALLNPQYLIQRTVTTIDNLPRTKIARQALVVKPVASAFEVAETGGRTLIAEDNQTRYAPYIRVAEAIDAKALIAVYVRFYPLFQQAYRELGYPDRYFNDRLMEVIDHLLTAPEVAGPIALVRTERGYAYADPELQSRSIGHKALIRIGGENTAKVKAKLREIRSALTGQPPPGA